jgi:FkbM family methyltransferase
MNNLDLKIIRAGLSDREGEAEFFVYTGLNYGKSGLKAPQDDPNVQAIRVILHTGDDLVRKKRVRPPHVVKIDVEGHELFAFRGMQDILRGDTLRAIVFEDVPEAGSPVKKFLAEYGFRFRELKPSEYMVHSDYADYIAER